MIAIYKPGAVGWDDFDYISEYAEIPLGWTSISPPQPCWRPVFDFALQEWTETATEEEKHPVGEGQIQPNEIELIKEELIEQKQQTTFLEEIILELADLVIGDSVRGGEEL